MTFKETFYPETRFGGYTDIDGTVAFYHRVNSLLKPSDVVLDVGCGRGEYVDDPVAIRKGLRVLRGKVAKVIGLDVDPAAQTNGSGARRSDWLPPDTTRRNDRPSARMLMDSYVAEGLSRNLALAGQSLAEKRAGYGVREADGRLLPSVGLNARYTEFSGVVNIGDFINPTYRALNQILGEDRFPTNINSTLPQRQETKLALTQSIYNAALYGNRELARAIRDASGAQRRLLMRQLSADIQTAWLGYARSGRVLQSLRATLPVLDENLRVSERLVAGGQATVDAIYRARAERSELLQQIAEAEQNEAAARRAFNLLRHREGDAPVTIALPAPTEVSAWKALCTVAADAL